MPARLSWLRRKAVITCESVYNKEVCRRLYELEHRRQLHVIVLWPLSRGAAHALTGNCKATTYSLGRRSPRYRIHMLFKHEKEYMDLSMELSDPLDWQAGTLKTLKYHLDTTVLAVEPISGLLATGASDIVYGNILYISL